MAKRISPEVKAQIPTLYAQLGTYSAVAKQLGISAATVSKYIKNHNSIKTYSTTNVRPKPISEIQLSDVLGFATLTKEEIASLYMFVEEVQA